MTAQIEAFETSNPLDSTIYLDTSVLVLHYGSQWSNVSRSKAQRAQRFLVRCAQEDVVLVVSLWALQELRTVVFRGMYSRRAKKLGAQDWKAAYAQDPSFCEQVHGEIERVQGLLEQYPSLVVLDRAIDSGILERALGYVFQYHLEPADALHVVVAQAEGVSTFATTDRSWVNVPGVRLYVPL